jgi:Fe-S-cluster containining protein
MARKLYDCTKCPGYCCSYPVIEVKDRDAARIAKHFDLSLAEAEKKYFKPAHGHSRVMRRKKDKHFGKICQFFDTEARRCTIYEARPSTCRIFPGEGRCGYYDFLKFERSGQEDEDYISTTWHAGN